MHGKVKRGPGRPRKVVQDDSTTGSEDEVLPTKKKRGRPLKVASASPPETATMKRKPGRPPSVKGKVGRPRKNPPPSEADTSTQFNDMKLSDSQGRDRSTDVTEKKKRGRPKKMKALNSSTAHASPNHEPDEDYSPSSAPSPTNEEITEALLSSPKLTINGDPVADDTATEDDKDDGEMEESEAEDAIESDLANDSSDAEDEDENYEDMVTSKSSTPKKRNVANVPSLKCVCNWGEECARFRRYFDRVEDSEGFCLYTGTVRPNIGGGERQANFLDAVDRHLCTPADVRQKTSGRYAIAYHHWSKEVLEYLRKLNMRTLLAPVSNDIAIQLGLTSDPLDEYQSAVLPDEYGRLRPMRDDPMSSDGTESEDEDDGKRWVVAPSHSYADVKAIVDAGVTQEIRQRVGSMQQEQLAQDRAAIAESETNQHLQSIVEKDRLIAELRATITEKESTIKERDEQIVDLEEQLERANDASQMSKLQIKNLIKTIPDI